MVSGHISLSLIASFGLCLYFLVQRYRRLSSVPGPWLASLTDLWRAHAQNYRQFTQILLQLHDQYGPLVRIGPNMVSVSDAKAVPSIYTTHGEFTKVCHSNLHIMLVLTCSREIPTTHFEL